jgi:hypothetical protein
VYRGNHIKVQSSIWLTINHLKKFDATIINVHSVILDTASDENCAWNLMIHLDIAHSGPNNNKYWYIQFFRKKKKKKLSQDFKSQTMIAYMS